MLNIPWFPTFILIIPMECGKLGMDMQCVVTLHIPAGMAVLLLRRYTRNSANLSGRPVHPGRSLFIVPSMLSDYQDVNILGFFSPSRIPANNKRKEECLKSYVFVVAIIISL